ncbi:hypothetical protein [Tardiphaga sp. 839_C3_N1_4]|uniref:hypothetical protein n=1 Tax=Tardiphaga sp. 839_C3_N1_4 TaxID=3240761 RepID=UPI003F27E09E
MTYQAEVAKEYLRNAFQSGALDVTGSFEAVKGFVQIFAGEMDALIAISHCLYLEDDERKALLVIAKPTDESVRHYKAWLERVTA